MATRTETATAPIEWVGTSAGSKSCRATINGEPLTLKVPKGTRGVKVGATLKVRIEWRDWYSMSRTTFHMREGTSETVSERREYHDGLEHAHYYFDGIEPRSTATSANGAALDAHHRSIA